MANCQMGHLVPAEKLLPEGLLPIKPENGTSRRTALGIDPPRVLNPIPTGEKKKQSGPMALTNLVP